MHKDNAFYKGLNLRKLAMQVPVGKERREVNESFHDIVTAIALRCKDESITSQDLLDYLGSPDSIQKIGSDEIWEYN